MKLPFTKPKTAPVADLEAQLEAARTNAREADARVEAAIQAFDEAASPATERALVAARDEARVAGEYVARSERLLAAARDREAAHARAKVEARIRELEAELAQEQLRALREPGLQAEFSALVAAIEAHAARADVERVIFAKRQELANLRVSLGAEPRTLSLHDLPSVGQSPVLELLGTTLQHRPPERWQAYLRALRVGFQEIK
jgi:hypothetical protein